MGFTLNGSTLIVWGTQERPVQVMRANVDDKTVEILHRRHGEKQLHVVSLRELVDAVDPNGTTWTRIG